tara:strand:- start:20 stop:403 length:384 start_codon:yes stop_codon:yes gene_type:complete
MLNADESSKAKLYLGALEKINDTTLPVTTVKTLISELAESPTPCTRTAKKYIKGMNIRVARSSDKGRVLFFDRVECVSKYFILLEKVLQAVNYDPCYIFNVDEVGIQLQERKIKMATQKDLSTEISK